MPDRAPMWGNLAEVISRFAPQHHATLHPSFSLSNPKRLHRLFSEAGFRDIRVERIRREETTESFDEYWAPIEAGIGSIPKVYLTLAEAERRTVRDEVQARLAPYEPPDGKLHMGVEMLIGCGRV